MRLAKRKILITGAASGIGRAVADLFRDEGAAVALLDKNAEGLAEAAAYRGHRSFTVTIDLAQHASIPAAVESCVQALGGLDGVANVAGVTRSRHTSELEMADWHGVFDVNLHAPLAVCKAALPALRAAGAGSGASIVNVASGSGFRPNRGSLSYSCSKAALIMLGKGLALDLAEYNIRVNTISPGPTDTAMLRGSASFKDLQAANAQKRVGNPREIAMGALYLISHESSYVTGTNHFIDGGRHFQ